MTFSWFFLLSNLETVINLGCLFNKISSAFIKSFFSNSLTGLIPGFITVIISGLTPFSIARFFVNSELDTTIFTLFNTSNNLLLSLNQHF